MRRQKFLTSSCKKKESIVSLTQIHNDSIMDETAEALKHSKHSLVPCAMKHRTNGIANSIY